MAAQQHDDPPSPPEAHKHNGYVALALQAYELKPLVPQLFCEQQPEPAAHNV